MNKRISTGRETVPPLTSQLGTELRTNRVIRESTQVEGIEGISTYKKEV